MTRSSIPSSPLGRKSGSGRALPPRDRTSASGKQAPGQTPRRSLPASSQATRPRHGRYRRDATIPTILQVVGLVSGIWLILGLGLGLVMDAVYAGQALPGSTLAGRDVTGLALDQAGPALDQAQTEIQLTLSVSGGAQRASGVDLGITIDREQVLADLEQADKRPFWIYRSPVSDIPLTVTIDQEKLNSWLRLTFPAHFQAPVNAGLAYDPSAQAYSVTAAASGTAISQSDLATIATTLAAQSGKGIFNLTPAADPPTISDENALATQTWINQRLKNSCALALDGQTLYTLTPDDIASVTVITVTAEGTLTAQFDSAKIRDFIQVSLAGHLNQPPVAEKVLTDEEGHAIGTTQEGVAGRSLTAIDTMEQELAQCLNSGAATMIPLAFTELPFPTEQTATDHPAPPPGSEDGHWADVNLTNQTVTLMDGAMPGSTFLMSSGAPDHPTPEGVFHVYAKVPVQSLRGCVGGECYDYPDVRWAIWFYQDYGFHTAYWHDDFGTAVSHGCLNLREADAAAVYDWLSHQDAVNIHV